ncbi:MAG: pilus assembly protein CpaC [Geobacter sp.]|nr:MAG: pilus assembly protein CpaC [Geobacter sp.]
MKLFRSNPCLLPIYLLLLLMPAATCWGGIPTEVTVNKSILLNLKKPAARISIANPALAELILISPQQLQINGTAPGTTNLIVWEKGNDKPSFFDLKISGDSGAMESQLKEIAPNDTLNIQYANDTLVLSGNTANEQTRTKAEQIAKAYSAKVINHIRIDEPQQVLLQVKVAQVDKTSLKKLGISYLAKGKTAEGFSNLIGSPKDDISGNAAALGNYNPLDAYQLGVSYFPAGVGAVLNALTTKGLAKVLAEPNLLVNSAQEGDFFAGTKIPITILQTTGGSSTASINYETVGIKLKFKPQVMENGLISLKINPAEVSSITGYLPVNGYPIIDTRSVNTSVELKDGESLIMAGLLQEEAIKNMSKIPLLGDIPILGALFRSTQNDIKEKELVFFITPKIIKPMAPGAKTELPTDRKLTPAEERELKWMPLGE